jgi:hypothetical protein
MTDRQTHITPVPQYNGGVETYSTDMGVWLEQFQRAIDEDIANIDLDVNRGIQYYGAIGDGVANDTDAIDNASTANPVSAFVPYTPDTYIHSDTAYTLSGNFHGQGTIETTDGKRGNNVLRLLSAPSTLSNGNGLNSFWTNKHSFMHNYDIAVSGASTVGTPATGYVQYDQVHPQFFGAYYSAGHNESLTDADGRTGWAISRYRLQQDGDGDAFCLNLNCVVSNENSSHTGLFGTPAGGLWNGNVTAAANQVYLNPVEYNIQSGIYDVRAAGLIINMDRDENAAADGEWWCGSRMQSTGTDPADAAYQVSGTWNVGLDLTPATITNSIALKDGQKIHFDAVSATVGGASTYASTFNNSYLWMTSNVFQYVHKGTGVLSVDTDSFDVSNRKTIVQSMATAVRAESTSQALSATTDSVLIVDASATNPTFTLPLANAMGSGKAQRITVNRHDSAATTVTIQRAGSDTIEDKTGTAVNSFTVAANQAVELVSDGSSQWHILYIA